MLEKEKIKHCKKCDEEIGGKAYYMVKLDCIFDGNQSSKCDTILLCSKCYHELEHWLAN